MAKYDEIMNHIKMTEERRSRILEQIKDKVSDEEKPQDGSNRKIWLLAATAAAAFLIIAVPSYFFRLTPDNNNKPSVENTEETTTAYTVSETVTSAMTETSNTENKSESSFVTTYKQTEITTSGYISSVTSYADVTELPYISDAGTYTPSPDIPSSESLSVSTTEPGVLIPPAVYTSSEEHPDVSEPPSTSENPAETTVAEPEEKTYSSLEEMADATGYILSHLKLDFIPEYTEYYSYGGIPETDYFGENGEVIFYRTYSEPGDHSGYYGYDTEEIFDIRETEVTIKRAEEFCAVALWYDGKYYHSMAVFYNPETGFDKNENILKIIEDQFSQE